MRLLIDLRRPYTALSFMLLSVASAHAGIMQSELTVTPNAQRFLTTVASGPATWVFIGDSITYGTGATTLSSSWPYQVVTQIQKLGNYYGGSGFCSTEGSGSCASSSTGTWTALQGIGPSQSLLPSFGEVKNGSNGATWSTGPYLGNIIDVVYYTNSATTARACSISVDGAPAVFVGGSTPAATPHLYSVGGLNDFVQHTVTVTSDGTCNLYGSNFRNASGLQIWNTARGGATTAAFSSVDQLSWLGVVPNLAGIVVALGQNDIGSLSQAQSLINVKAIVSMNQSLANPVPILFLYTEAPKYDAGQGALYAAIQSTVATPNGSDSLSIYNWWGANSYITLPFLYIGGTDVIHPSQAGHDSIASAVLSSFGLPVSISPAVSTVMPYGTLLGEKDNYGNTVSIASITNGDQVNLGGAYAGQVNIGTGGPGGVAELQILNNGHIAIAPNSAPPVAAACGASPSINGNDVKGEIAEGTGATGCKVVFGTAYSTAPSCVVSMQTGSIQYSISASTISVVNGTGTAPGKINYICF